MTETPYEPTEEELSLDGYPDEPKILAKLLVDDVLFVGNAGQGPFFAGGEQDPEVTACVYVACNDMFAWGCADAENVTTDELPELYRMHSADKRWGSTKWVAKRRNLQPQAPVIKMMKDDNSWDESMEALGKNRE